MITYHKVPNTQDLEVGIDDETKSLDIITTGGEEGVASLTYAELTALTIFLLTHFKGTLS